ncbi:MAG: phosphotransferase [Streptosporangiales bacterium]|nr:phosphotransferase [Streptosporangiales bacterium]
MSAGHKPAAEVHIDVPLVRRLLNAQFPQWADLPIQPVDASGWDNAIYRLGSDLAVRLPRRGMSAGQVEKEHQWLPMLVPVLPLAIPAPLGKGTPAEGYPWHWTVCRWLHGEIAAAAPLADPGQAALDLARFIKALRTVATTNGPRNELRGVPLATRDQFTRADINSVRDRFDVTTVTAAWDAALAAPQWQGPPVWFHGDLHPANLLVEDGQLTAVIDFGLLAVGDPACDVMAAWTVFSADVRNVFRTALSVDDATWARGRGWALLLGLLMTAHSADNPVLDHIGQHTVNEVLADDEQQRPPCY